MFLFVVNEGKNTSFFVFLQERRRKSLSDIRQLAPSSFADPSFRHSPTPIGESIWTSSPEIPQIK